jgi:hypothetical protein
MSGPVSAGEVERSVESYRPYARGEDTKLRQLLAEWPLPAHQRFGCYLIDGSSQYSDLARGLECSVFHEFFGNEPSIMYAEYAEYELHSKFVLVVDQERLQLAGTLRVIANSARGLKTLNDIARAPLSVPLAKVIDCHRIDSLDKCWDIGTLAVLKEYRGRSSNHLVSTMLYGVTIAAARTAGIEHFVAIMDQHAFSQLTEMLGLPFVPIANSPPFEYIGSGSSRAGYAFVPSFRSSVEAYMKTLDDNRLQQLRPCLARTVYGEDLPTVVEI